MTFDLRHYIQLLESTGQLTRIAPIADPLLEISAITNRVCKQAGGGKALLFENPLNFNFPVATNLFGSHDRTALALGVSETDQLSRKMSSLLDQLPDFVFSKLDAQITALHDFAAFLPAIAKPAWEQTQKVPDLLRFPFLQNWPGDGSASGHPCYITFAQVITSSPDGSSHNCGIYRAQITGTQTLAIRWHPGSGASLHLEQYRREQAPMPIALALGGDPALLFSAMMPLPGNLDEMIFAGFLRGYPQKITACHTVPLMAPSGAELVIEGHVDPSETAMEGPFGNHTGHYAPAGAAAVMRISAIHHRHDAIIPATVVGPPPMEDCWMTFAWERIMLAFLKKCAPQIVDIHIPQQWSFHQSAIISLEKLHPGMISELVELLWGLPWFRNSRIIVFVSATDVALTNIDIAWQCINHIDFAHDLIFDASKTRMAIDATSNKSLLESLSMPPAILERIARRWHTYGAD